MSELRRRLAKDAAQGEDPAAAGSRPGSSSSTTSINSVAEQQLKAKGYKPRSKRRNGLIFALGGLFGIFIALFFANQNQVISLDALMDLNLDSLIDVIPQGIVKDVREFSVRCFTLSLSLYIYLSALCWTVTEFLD